MKKKTSVLIILLSLVFLFSSGCTDLLPTFDTDNTITFQSYPTTIRYTIEYGFNIISEGTGNAMIRYHEDIPDLPEGTLLSMNVLNSESSETITIANNTMVQWNYTMKNSDNTTLGLQATVQSGTLFVETLKPTETLTLNQIQTNQNNLIKQYCKSQGNNTHWLIEPDYPPIQQKAQQILENSETNNSFEIAKNIFRWVKEQTSYTTHPNQDNTQPASETFQQKTGDCDDLSFLYLSMLRAIDIPCRFIKGFLLNEIGNDSIQAISHLWVEVFVGGNLGLNGWIPVECAGTANVDYEIYQNFGIEDAMHLRQFTGDGSNTSLIKSSSHILVEYSNDMNVNIVGFENVTDYNIIDSKKLCISDDTRSYC
jgi:hypothetical protein